MSAQFIEEWNNVFDFKLRESDLQNPTEHILFSALSNYLEHININVPKMREESMQDEKSQLQFKVEFCSYIDRLFKISKPQEQFLCYDLMQPTSKKTIYLLKLLLNFYHFYNMIRVQVGEKSNDLIHRYETAISDRNKCVKDNQLATDQVESIVDQLNNLAETLPNLQKSVDNLKKSNDTIDEEIAKTQGLLADTKLENISIQQKIQELHDSTVTEEQVQSVKGNRAKLDEEYAELCEIEESTLEGKTGSNAMMEAAEANLELMTGFLDKYTVVDATSAKLVETKVKKQKRSTAEATDLRDQLQVQINSKLAEYKLAKSQLTELESQISEANLADDRTIYKLKRQTTELTGKNTKLVAKIKNYDTIIEGLHQQILFLVRESSRLHDHIRFSKD